MIYHSSERIDPQPIGRGPHFYGVELEIESRGVFDVQHIAQSVVEQFPPGFVICKRDGSLFNGFEIVTKPASIAHHRKAWKGFFDWKDRKRLLTSYDQRSTGLHVHCSRAPLDVTTIGRMLVFLNRQENRPFITGVSQRNYWEYCQLKAEKSLEDAQHYGPERYEALNLCNPKTVEFRLFKGNCSPLAVMRSIEFCDALIRFCERSCASTAWQSVPVFCSFVYRQRNRWPSLDLFLIRHSTTYRNTITNPNTQQKRKSIVCV